MKLTAVTPSLFTDDIDRSIAFYRDVLGFEVRITVPDRAPFVFVSLERDGITVFLNDAAAARRDASEATWLTVGKSGVTMFIDMENIVDFWTQIKGKAPVAMPLVEQWYGLTEFSVTDPDGYLLTFAEKTAK